MVLPSMPRGVPLQLSRAKKALARINHGKWQDVLIAGQSSLVLQDVDLPTDQIDEDCHTCTFSA